MNKEDFPTQEELIKINQRLLRLISSVRDEIINELKNCHPSVDNHRIIRLNATIKGIDMTMETLGYEKFEGNKNA